MSDYQSKQQVDQKRLEKFFEFAEHGSDKREIARFLGPLVGIKVSKLPLKDVPRCFVNQDRTKVYMKFPYEIHNMVFDSKFYESSIASEDLAIFTIDYRNKDAIDKILDGRVTQMRPVDKKLIIEHSGLPYGRSYTYRNADPILLALNRNSVLRRFLADWFEVSPRALPDEFISAVPEDSEIYIENYLKNRDAK